MAKKIETLVSDIQALLTDPHDFDKKIAEVFGQNLATIVGSRLTAGKEVRGGLRMSNVGHSCLRRLWYDSNKPEEAEPLPPEARVKFLFGDVFEELLIFLAKEAGHEVTGEQTELDLEGLKGHRDCVIDGMQVDVKSASSPSFKKFKEGLTYEDDVFGYLVQQNCYLEAAKDDPLVRIKDQFAFLVIDKQLGHIHLDVHKKDDNLNIRPMVRARMQAMQRADLPPRGFAPQAEGASGNEVLGTQCSYCPFKKSCYPSLRTFIYAGRGPKFFTRVVREPNVPEVKSR